MEIFFQGILFGLALTVLVGPIFFILLQTGIEEGFRAGMKVGLGIWTSDLLFVGGIILSVNEIVQLVASPMFKPLLGIVGGLVLMILGVSMFVSRPADMDSQHFQLLPSKWKLYLHGFLINTLNPFTVIFWTSVITSFALEESLFSSNSFLFFGSILAVIVFTDSLKIYLAEIISKKLQPFHIILMRKISGVALFLFEIAMIIRVSWGG